MYHNQEPQQKSEPPKSVYTSVLEFFALIVAFIAAALFGTYLAYFTMPLILSIAVPVFGSAEEGSIKFFWLIASHALIFFGVAFMAHLKLTSFGASVIMKPFKEQEQEKKNGGGFVKFMGWMVLIFALFSLTGCNEEQTRKELSKQENDHAHSERMKDKEMHRDLTIARERGNFELAKQKEENKHYEESQTSLQKHEFDLAEALYATKQATLDAWHTLIDNTAVPFLKFLAVVASVLVGCVLVIKRLCAMNEKLAEERTKQEAVKAFAQAMSAEERRKAFESMDFLSDPNVIDMHTIGS